MKLFVTRICWAALVLISVNAFAVPIDWNGSLGFDTNIIKNVRGTTDSCTATDGSQCNSDDNSHARYQSMLLRLNPNLIVNDSTTIKGELSVGTFRGNFLGADSALAEDGSYFSQTSKGDSALVVNQLYAELYADTALFKVGKFSKHFGLGAIISEGKGSWDRYYSLYNGFEAYFKLGNFKLTPTWAKVGSSVGTPGTPANAPSGKYDAYETGITALYDNSNNNMKAGVYYAIRDVETSNTLYENPSSTSQSVNIIDIFFERVWGNFYFGLEIPILSGDLGNSFSGSDSSYSSTSYILETSYQVNPKWKFGFDGGMIKGSDGENSDHEALYLHPNYQIAEVMFRYNLQGFQSSSENIFSSSIVNTNYTKFYARYTNEAWAWNFAFIMAKANEVASNGSSFFDHRSKKYITAADDQDNDLGWEFDTSFDYEWNPSIFITGFLGYYKVGDFYNFTNNNGDIEVSDITATGLRLSVNF